MSHPRDIRFVWLCALTIFVSAFLLFQVQPLITKIILPWFGGGPAVWTTCVLFFQVLLLGGYAYAHCLPVVGDTRRQVIVHISLLAVAVLLLPILPRDSWKPENSEFPTSRILWLLAANVAIPYFLLSTTGPLVQQWFSRACPDRSPYPLYSLSNVGSLLALVSYPFVFEPLLGITSQSWIWSGAFFGFALLSGGLAISIWRSGVPLEVAEDAPQLETGALPPGVVDRLLWLVLPTIGSVALLAITNHLCQDVAVVPFLWIAPFALYLLSFILCFADPRIYQRWVFAAGAAGAIMMVTGLQNHTHVKEFIDRHNLAQQFAKAGLTIDIEKWNDNILLHAAAYLLAMFCICMLSHGEMVRRKPATRHLTAFYLMTSAGGALGGIFVALICPVIFSAYRELNLILCVGYLLAGAVLVAAVYSQIATGPAQRSAWRMSGAVLLLVPLFVLIMGSSLVATGQWNAMQGKSLVAMRSFYGVLRVEDEETTVSDEFEGETQVRGRQLLNGRILHGYQFLDFDRRKLATTYFTPHSGIGIAISHFPRQAEMKVGVIGLGAGTIAAYGSVGDTYRFYEINPQVIRIAEDKFSFLKDSPAKIEVVLGDARLSLEREASQQFDVFALDAFSGDAIPVHLLTSEALAIYLRHIKPDGVIAIHISNLHLDLLPVVVGLARQQQLRATLIRNGRSFGNSECSSDWVLLTRNEEFLSLAYLQEMGEEQDVDQGPARIWTDKFSNLYQILK